MCPGYVVIPAKRTFGQPVDRLGEGFCLGRRCDSASVHSGIELDQKINFGIPAGAVRYGVRRDS